MTGFKSEMIGKMNWIATKIDSMEKQQSIRSGEF